MKLITPMRSWAVLGLVACVLGGCGGGNSLMESDPLMLVRDPEQTTNTRVKAADHSWEMVETGAGSRTATRESFKSLAWPKSTPSELRVEVMRLLLSDTNPEGQADAKEMAKLMLPNETDPTLVELLCQTAAENGWVDFTTAIVRVWAEPRTDALPGSARPERAALERLHPGRPVEEVVFEVFLDPKVEDGPFGIDWPARARADAWDVLTQLDPDGSMRWQLLDSPGARRAAAEGVKEVVDVRLCLLELRTIPRTSQELHWLRALRADDKPSNAAWWRKSSSVLDALGGEQKRGLELRHIEPIRWASVNRAGWLTASREMLIAELRSRQASREIHERTARAKINRPRRETVGAWESSMNWGDALTILVVDEALRSQELAYNMFVYAEQDREDTTTEYGGILTEQSGVYVAYLYPPRAKTRRSDNEFVASDEMIAASDLALAHYHLQVQEEKSEKFAGPSEGDLVYAARSGRTCLVFTSIDEDTLNVDVYQPDGLVIDLGEIARVESPR